MGIEEIVEFVEDKSGESARSSLESYFYKNAFTGRRFETFFASDTPNEFTANDFIAVSMLSVRVPPRAAARILVDNKNELINSLKKVQPPEVSIVDDGADLSKGSATYLLWKGIFGFPGIGETIASKLLATKRPNLFPIFDSHVAKALDLDRSFYWKPWQDFMKSDEGRKCVQKVRGFAVNLKITGVSDLRLLDIIIWMRVHGHKFITQDLVDNGWMKEVSYAPPEKPKKRQRFK